MDAVAEMVMQEMRGDDEVNISSASLDMSTKRQIGEEMILDKINQIFDEVQKQNQPSETF
jgi:hypothetical protein